MEPFEWLVLGIGLALGALFGSRGKAVLRSTAKGFMALEEKTREITANVREDFRDAVEEARYEREHEVALDSGSGAEISPAIAGTPHDAPRRGRASGSGAARSGATPQASRARKAGRPSSSRAAGGSTADNASGDDNASGE